MAQIAHFAVYLALLRGHTGSGSVTNGAHKDEVAGIHPLGTILVFLPTVRSHFLAWFHGCGGNPSVSIHGSPPPPPYTAGPVEYKGSPGLAHSNGGAEGARDVCMGRSDHALRAKGHRSDRLETCMYWALCGDQFQVHTLGYTPPGHRLDPLAPHCPPPPPAQQGPLAHFYCGWVEGSHIHPTPAPSRASFTQV